MMNDPLAMMRNMLRSGMNPNAVANRLLQSDPRFAKVQQITAGKSQEQIYQMVCNMCRERGTTPEEVARQLGLR